MCLCSYFLFFTQRRRLCSHWRAVWQPALQNSRQRDESAFQQLLLLQAMDYTRFLNVPPAPVVAPAVAAVPAGTDATGKKIPAVPAKPAPAGVSFARITNRSNTTIF